MAAAEVHTHPGILEKEGIGLRTRAYFQILCCLSFAVSIQIIISCSSSSLSKKVVSNVEENHPVSKNAKIMVLKPKITYEDIETEQKLLSADLGGTEVSQFLHKTSKKVLKESIPS
jgi:hypothetical protein